MAEYRKTISHLKLLNIAISVILDRQRAMLSGLQRRSWFGRLNHNEKGKYDFIILGKVKKFSKRVQIHLSLKL